MFWIVFLNLLNSIGAPKDIPPPITNLADTSNSHLMVTPGVSKRHMASASAMEVSNMSMPDISEEDVIQMDTPGYYLGTIFTFESGCFNFLILIYVWNRC